MQEALIGFILGLYAVASLVCFTMHALDKSAARAGRRRIPESSLLVSGFAFGWPGGLLAQRWLRHKTAKAAFQLRFRLAAGLNVAMLIGFFGLLLA
ncbi:DUF1294 domain-containing protein [Massilia cavernae]|uniref:DUF1294 domain-containing protein n=1 Tax=Massilia cavernae TaxID=2320864 RepID=A0A418XAK0_9BURK|nr:DUF1294 domain-containing protein [Massilia cavernae]RJG09539.1 DUF1294 domain-containing protein [Massilia cavernae]